MNSKIFVLGLLILIIGICGIYGYIIDKPGTYYVGENITLGKDVTIKVNSGTVKIIGDSNDYLGVITISEYDNQRIEIYNIKIEKLKIKTNKNNIKLQNIEISSGDCGIYIKNRKDNHIYGNILKISANSYGIYISGDDADNNIIQGINGEVIGKWGYGIYIFKGDYNTISGNIKEISGNDYGIYIEGQSNGANNNKIYINGIINGSWKCGIYINNGKSNEILGNITEIYGGSYGIYISGNGNKGGYNRIENITGVVIGKLGYGIYIYNVNNNTISGNISKVEGGNYGIYISGDGADNNTIQGINGNISGGDSGIYIKDGDNNGIYGDMYIKSGGNGTGIYLSGNAYNNIISGKIYEVSGGYGIYIDGEDCDSNKIIGIYGEITANYRGIYINKGDNNEISGNITKIYGYNYGVYIDKGADENKIIGINGDIIGERFDGIWIYYQSDNNEISGNITKIYGGQYGIKIERESKSNHIVGINGNIIGNSFEGIRIVDSGDNTIYGDITKIEGGNYGIYIEGDKSDNNNITGINGEIKGNSINGIHIDDGDSNKIIGNITKIYGGQYGVYIGSDTDENKISGARYIPSSGYNENDNLIYHCKIYGGSYSVYSDSYLTAYYNYIDNNIAYTKNKLINSKSQVEYYLNVTAYLNGETDLFKIIIPKEDAEKYNIDTSGLKNFTNYLGNQYKGFKGNDTNSDGIIDDKYYPNNENPIDKYVLIGTPHIQFDIELRSINIDNAILKDGKYILLNKDKTYVVEIRANCSEYLINSSVDVELWANNTLIDTKKIKFDKTEKIITFSWTPTNYGTYTLKGSVDYDNKINETDENNNNKTITVVIPKIEIDFNWTKPAVVNKDITFTPIIKINNKTVEDDKSILGEISLTWDFGDGSPEVSDKYPNPATHKYDESGTYSLTLKAKSELGWSGIVDHTIIITEKTHYPPIAKFTFTINGMNVTFNASESYDIDGKIVKYIWDFGDGTTQETPNPITSHTYKESKVYTVKLKVVDDSGLTEYTIRFVSIGEGRSIPIPMSIKILLFITTILIIIQISRWKYV